jgi:hypothetical protein
MTKAVWFEVSHPSDKNKDVARVGHPEVGHFKMRLAIASWAAQDDSFILRRTSDSGHQGGSDEPGDSAGYTLRIETQNLPAARLDI